MSPIVRDLSNICGVSLLKANAQEAATTTGTGVDFAGAALYQGVMFVAELTTNANPTGQTIDLTIDGSDDGTTWTTGVAVFDQWDVSTAAGLYYADFVAGAGPMRYYRYVDTQTASADATFAIFAIGVNPSQANVTQV